jgi:glycerophosphoryl diester phosphodiesterase
MKKYPFTITNKRLITGAVITLALLAHDYLYAANSVKADKIVVAHRGASGYLPEHSMDSKELAFKMGADYIEQDLVLSKDNQLLVLHDLYLDNVTDVAAVYPSRARGDGHFYAIDFTYDEIKQLRLTERFKVVDGKQVAVFASRTPLWQGQHKVHLFEQELALIAKLNAENDKNVGIYTEIKSPSFHRNEGKDISKIVLGALKKAGFDKKSSNIYLQSFDAIELKRIDSELLPSMQMDLKLVQLIAMTSWGLTKEYHANKVSNYSYDWMFAADGMSKVAEYADGVGPFKRMLISKKSTANKLEITPLLSRAHAAGLVVHPYTFRADEGRVEKYANSFEDMLDIFYFKLGVDGVFTDYPDKAVKFLKSKGYDNGASS